MSLPKERFLREKFLFFESFWKGEGPYPLLFAKPHLAKDKNYLLHDLEEQHRHPVKLPTILPYVPDNQGGATSPISSWAQTYSPPYWIPRNSFTRLRNRA